MATRTLLQLRTGARQRADMQDDGNFIPDAELTDYVNESISDLYDVLTDGDPGQLFSKNSPILTQVGTNSYLLPSDFYKLTSVELLIGGFYHHGREADIGDYSNLAQDPPQAEDFRYLLRSDPSTGVWHLFTFPELDEANLAVVYIPEAPVLSSDSDTYNGINNWQEYVVVDAAIKMLQKEESDTVALEFRRKRLEERIKDHIRDITVGEPDRIREISHIYERPFYWYPRSR